MKKILSILVLCLVVAVTALVAAPRYETVKVPCQSCGGSGVVTTYYGPAYCPNCGGAGGFVTKVWVDDNGPAFRGDSKTFVKTSNACDDCSCKGYWGYRHSNGTYEGKCSNTDRWGHKCGHSPEHHGLRSW